VIVARHDLFVGESLEPLVSFGDTGVVLGPSTSLDNSRICVRWDRRRDGKTANVNVLPEEVRLVPDGAPLGHARLMSTARREAALVEDEHLRKEFQSQAIVESMRMREQLKRAPGRVQKLGGQGGIWTFTGMPREPSPVRKRRAPNKWAAMRVKTPPLSKAGSLPSLLPMSRSRGNWRVEGSVGSTESAGATFCTDIV
jgi:hypothetical protein